jgi:hypothetical protein
MIGALLIALPSFQALQVIKENKDSSLRRLSGGQLCHSLYHKS